MGAVFFPPLSRRRRILMIMSDNTRVGGIGRAQETHNNFAIARNDSTMVYYHAWYADSRVLRVGGIFLSADCRAGNDIIY